MRGDDLRKHSGAVLQARTLREHGHATRVLPWHRLVYSVSRAVSAIWEDGRAFSNVYPGIDRMLSRKYRVGSAGWAYFLRILADGKVGTPGRRLVLATTSDVQGRAADGARW